jgi:hypothetical protein
MSIYLIKHSVKDFTGYFGGVDFYHGRGSTSSRADALRLEKLGCRVSESGTEEIETQDKGEADASPASFSTITNEKDWTVVKANNPTEGEVIHAPSVFGIEPVKDKKKPGRKPKAIK